MFFSISLKALVFSVVGSCLHSIAIPNRPQHLTNSELLPKPGLQRISSSTGGVRGIVLDREGHSVAGSKVILQHDNGGSWFVMSGVDGSFRIGGLPPGRYKVEIEKNGYARYRTPPFDVFSNTWELNPPNYDRNDFHHDPFPYLRIAGYPLESHVTLSGVWSWGDRKNKGGILKILDENGLLKIHLQYWEIGKTLNQIEIMGEVSYFDYNKFSNNKYFPVYSRPENELDPVLLCGLRIRNDEHKIELFQLNDIYPGFTNGIVIEGQFKQISSVIPKIDLGSLPIETLHLVSSSSREPSHNPK